MPILQAYISKVVTSAMEYFEETSILNNHRIIYKNP